MSTRISPIVFFANIAFTVFVIVYLIVVAPESILGKVFLGIAVTFALAQIGFYWSAKERLRKWYMYLVMANFLYLCVEILVYILFVLGIMRSDAQFLADALEANTKRWAKYDSIIGYRAIPGQFRNVKYAHNTMVYDHTCYINKQGWFSKEDYEPYKKNGIKRYAVLGDSFSAGFNIPEAWPDVVSCNMDSVELYNFSLEGIGINNWYLIYFNEVIKYDFDGLIVAISNEQFGVSDMDRKLMIMHSEDDATYIGQYDTLPTPEVFEKQKWQMNRGYSRIDSDQLDELVCGYLEDCKSGTILLKPDLYFLHTILDLFAQLKTYFEIEDKYEAYTATIESRFPADKPMMTLDDYAMKYPYAYKLAEIASHSLENGNDVILVLIPDYTSATNDYIMGQNDKEIRFLASQVGASYFNGFTCFGTTPEDEVPNYYYKHDLHWNQEGVYLFSNSFANWLSVENDVQ